jgi:poly(A) polymerase
MVEHHLRPSQTSQKDQMPTRKAVYRYFRDVGEVALDTIYLSLADFLAARGPTLDKEAWLFNSKRINYTIEEGTRIQQIENEPKLLDGHEISHLFDIKPSPELGELINQVRKAQAIGIIDTKQNAVAFIKDLLKGRSGIREFSASGTQK